MYMYVKLSQFEEKKNQKNNKKKGPGQLTHCYAFSKSSHTTIFPICTDK